MEHNESETWSSSVRDAVAAFTRQVGESSQQLAAAAEHFASESMRVIDDAARQAEASVTQSNEAAGAAGAAAAEARELTTSVRGALAEAADRVRQETSSFFQDAVRQTEQAVQASRQMTMDLQEKLDAAVRQIDSSVTSSRDFASQAASSAQEARQAAAEASSNEGMAGTVAEAVAEAARSATGEIVALREAVAGAERTAQEARLAAMEAGSNRGEANTVAEAAAATARTAVDQIVSLREAVAGAERAAQEAREVALEANALAQKPPAPAEPTVSAGAQEVLERLEADYSLLTKLVQELHARIASLSTQTAPVYQFIPPAPATPQLEADVNVEEASEPSYSEQSFTADETVAEMPAAEEPVGRSSWDEPAAAAAADSWNATRYIPGQAEPEVPAETAAAEPAPADSPSGPASPTIAGRVLVSISPVPDFDRLLSLDGALGRMAGIGNVTLADYAREEVTFRVEVDPPTSVEDFRSRLSLSAGASIEVVANGDDGLALRLAS